MRLTENIQISINGLLANKMRSFLTMLGIIIGIGSVIAIVTVGDSLTKTVNDAMGSFGVNTIQVYMYNRETDDATKPSGSDLITDEMIEKMETKYSDEIEAVALQTSGGSGKVQDGRRYANVSLSGVNPGYQVVNNVKMEDGRFINESDVLGRKMVAVVSDKLAAKMFGANVDPLGKTIQVYLTNSIQSFTIVGVYKYEASALMMNTGNEEDLSTALYFPISSTQQVTGKILEGYESFVLTAAEGVEVSTLSNGLTSTFEGYFSKNPTFSVTSVTFESYLDQMNVIMGALSMAISVIAGISLVVGGIGVMNIMLVSVTERTREIGTRKALGAQDGDIRAQFITEALILCLIGGFIGILLGLLMGYAGAILMASISPAVDGAVIAFSVPAILFAVGFSMLIGVFFGYYPANKAAKLDPIEALRYE